MVTRLLAYFMVSGFFTGFLFYWPDDKTFTLDVNFHAKTLNILRVFTIFATFFYIVGCHLLQFERLNIKNIPRSMVCLILAHLKTIRIFYLANKWIKENNLTEVRNPFPYGYFEVVRRSWLCNASAEFLGLTARLLFLFLSSWMPG